MAKKFSTLRKGDAIWVWRGNKLYEYQLDRVERVKPATLPAYSSKWIIHTDQKPYCIRLFITEDGNKDYYVIYSENFAKNVYVLTWDDEEEGGSWIIGTSKESIRKIVENSCKDAIKYAEEMLNKSMAEFE